MNEFKLPQELAEIAPFKKWENFQVTNDATKEFASQACAEIANRLAAVKAESDKVIGPIEKGVNAFKAMCKQVTDPLKLADKHLRTQLSIYLTDQQKKVDEEARIKHQEGLRLEKERLDAAKKTAAKTGDDAALEEVVKLETRVETLQAKPIQGSQTLRSKDFTMAPIKKWGFKIVDANLIPDDYFILDEQRFTSMCNSAKVDKKILKIPGIEFYEYLIPMVRK